MNLLLIILFLITSSLADTLSLLLPPTACNTLVARFNVAIGGMQYILNANVTLKITTVDGDYVQKIEKVRPSIVKGMLWEGSGMLFSLVAVSSEVL